MINAAPALPVVAADPRAIASADASLSDTAIDRVAMPFDARLFAAVDAATGTDDVAIDGASLDGIALVDTPTDTSHLDANVDVDGRPREKEVDAASDIATQLALVAQWVVSAPPSTVVPVATKGSADAVGGPDAAVDTVVLSGSREGRSSPGDGGPTLQRSTASVVGEGRDAASSIDAVDPQPIASDARRASTSLPTTQRPIARDARGEDRRIDVATIDRLPDAPALSSRSTPATSPIAPSTDASRDERAAPITATSTPDASFASQLAARLHASTNDGVTTRPLDASTPPAPTTIEARVGSQAWSHEVGHATLTIARGLLESASLRLNPEALGPLDVQVRIDDGVAHLAFHATHAETRQAIEASRPVLDALFANQGLSIGDCSVDDRAAERSVSQDAASSRQARDESNATGRQAHRGRLPIDDDLTLATASRGGRVRGLVDLFA